MGFDYLTFNYSQGLKIHYILLGFDIEDNFSSR